VSAIYPLHRSDLVAREIEDELVLFDAADEIVHVLNATARLVWHLCDAQHTPDDMAQVLRTHFAIPLDCDVLADVTETLAVFSTKGLLQDPERALTAQAESDSRPLADSPADCKEGASAHEAG